MIVTLAGHVDHGKTSLIKALTGVDTDVLAEERRRGLTIDLGFAYARDEGRAGARVLGFVDVPGHHRFIHNMVAGVANGQFALLAVAADDGPMPQTREHLQILSLTGLQRGLVALTKCDRVDEARLRAAQAEVRDCVRGTFLKDAAVHCTSVATGAGMPTLRQALWSAADQDAAIPAQGQFRLAVDRAFNLPGAGLVATGTVHAGRVAQDDELHLFPAGGKARVRSLRVQNSAAESAATGDRAAINLAGLRLERVRRGCWLTQKPVPQQCNFVVDLQVLENFPRPVRHWLPVHVYHATAHSTARLALLHGARAQPGSRHQVEIITDEPLCARHGDHLVLRDQSLDLTLGGGKVLADLAPTGQRRRDSKRLAPISAFRQASRPACIAALFEQGPVDKPRLQNTLGLTDAELAEALDALDLVHIGSEAVLGRHWSAWRQALLTFVKAYQLKHPAAPGAPPSELPASIPQRFRGPLLNALISQRQLQQTAGAYHLPAYSAELPPAERAFFDQIRPRLDRDQAPSVGDLAKSLHIPPPHLNANLKGVAQRGLLVQVSDQRFYLPERLTSIAARVNELAKANPLTVRRFRDQTGIGRNVAIELLEYLDGRGFTRRIGDVRTVVGQLKLHAAPVR